MAANVEAIAPGADYLEVFRFVAAIGDAYWNLHRRVMISSYHDVVAKQTTVRLPDELAQEAETLARVQGSSMNQLVIDSLRAEIKRVRADEEFIARAKRLLERDKELLERFAR